MIQLISVAVRAGAALTRQQAIQTAAILLMTAAWDRTLAATQRNVLATTPSTAAQVICGLTTKTANAIHASTAVQATNGQRTKSVLNQRNQLDQSHRSLSLHHPPAHVRTLKASWARVASPLLKLRPQ